MKVSRLYNLFLSRRSDLPQQLEEISGNLHEIKLQLQKNNSYTHDEIIRLISDHTSLDNRKREFDYLFKLFELYTAVQVEADTIYYNRTSIITLTQGLLLVAYQAVASSGVITNIAITVLGFVLAILWIFFEQRNLIFFKGRGHVLRSLEAKLLEFQKVEGLAFAPFWSEVPRWVNENAKWNQRFSAQLILRLLIPLLFSLVWLGLLMSNAKDYIIPLWNNIMKSLL